MTNVDNPAPQRLTAELLQDPEFNAIMSNKNTPLTVAQNITQEETQ